MTRDDWNREFPDLPDENADILIREGFVCPHPLNMIVRHPEGWELSEFDIRSDPEELLELIEEGKRWYRRTKR